MAVADRPTPIRSRRSASVVVVSAMNLRPNRTTTIPTGTLIRKIGRQDNPSRFASVRNPPSTGPATLPNDSTAP